MVIVRIKTMERGERNNVAFDNLKNKTIAFTRHWKANRRNSLKEAWTTVRRHTMIFNVEATRWLGMYPDTGLQFREHRNIFLEKAKHAKDRVRRLGLTYGLEPGLIRHLEVTAVQTVAL